MSLEDLRRALAGRGWDEIFPEVVHVEPGRDPAGVPSHRWVVAEDSRGHVLVGGTDRGELAAYDVLEDVEQAVALVDRLVRAERPPVPDDLAGLRERARAVEADLRAATSRVGADQVPVGTPLDHIGSASGHYLYLLDTPMPLRSLPPTDLNQPRTGYLVTRALPGSTTVQVAPAWFGQPGGALVLRLDRVIAAFVDEGYLTPFSVTD